MTFQQVEKCEKRLGTFCPSPGVKERRGSSTPSKARAPQECMQKGRAEEGEKKIDSCSVVEN